MSAVADLEMTGSTTRNTAATSEVVTLQKNSDNSTGNTFASYSPPVTVTYTISALANPNSFYFGSFLGSYNLGPMNTNFSPVNSQFTASGGAAVGSGIDVAANSAMWFVDAPTSEMAGQPESGNYYRARLTISFRSMPSRPSSANRRGTYCADSIVRCILSSK
ncbi:MAG: hypothetical protein EOO81_11335, partial [Oxalobacteraceae bacterium]